MESKDGSFEISLRVLGNEVIGLSLTVDDFKTKWVVLSVVSLFAISYTVATFGPSLFNMFN